VTWAFAASSGGGERAPESFTYAADVVTLGREALGMLPKRAPHNVVNQQTNEPCGVMPP